MPYLTAAELKSRLRDLSEFGNARIDRAVAEFEAVAERYCGEAFAPRTESYETVLTDWQLDLVLPHQRVSAVSSITVEGVAIAASTWVMRKRSGIVYRELGWKPRVPIVVGYTHGLAAVPTLIASACQWYVFGVLRMEDSGTSRDVVFTSTDGTVTRYSTPDLEAGRPTGWTEPDRLLRMYRSSNLAVGIA